MMTSQYLRYVVYFSTMLGVFGYVPLGLSHNNTEFYVSNRDKLAQANSDSNLSHSSSASVKSHAKLQIISIEPQNKSQSLRADQSLMVRIKATPGVYASVLLVADKHTIQETSAQEISPGIYQATIDFDSNTNIVEGVIMARLQHGRQVIYDAVDIPFSVTRVNPEGTCSLGGSQMFSGCNFNSSTPEVSSIPLSFTSHRNGEIVNTNNLIVRGKTQPSAEVSIKVNSSLPLIGDLMKLEGETLVNQTIIADQEGDFSFVIPQGRKTVSGLKYEISALATVADRTSKLVKLTLQQN